MKDIYTKIIYPDIRMTYPALFCNYIFNRFFNFGHKKLLDIGCNKGTHIDIFEKIGLDCYGIDVRVEHKKAKKCNVEKQKFPFENNTFDYIFSKSVIEHISDPTNMIKEAYRVLKTNGVIVLLTPDWKSQMNYFWDDYTHVHPYTRKSLDDMLQIFGFKNVGCEYFYQLPFIWKKPWLKFIPKIISLLPESLKWKNKHERNGQDRKLIRFSQELMLLSWGTK